MTMMPEVWDELDSEAQGVTDIGFLKRLVAPESVCPLFLGIQCPGKSRVFLLQVPRNLLPSRDQIPDSRGFHLSLLPVTEDDDDLMLVLSATSSLYNDVFSAMAADLCESLARCSDARHLVSTFLERLVHWQQFCERNRSDGLSDEAQQGLYGELIFFKCHVIDAMPTLELAVDSWTGPKRRQHDFQFGAVSVEVKTSSTKHHQRFFVSGEQQFDENNVEFLFVVYCSVSRIDNHADTLPALITEIREYVQTSHAALSRFNELLIEGGYLDTQAWRYRRTGYAIREITAFHVRDDFPRITEQDLLPGVGDVTYSVDVDVCRRFELPMDDVISLIQRGR